MSLDLTALPFADSVPPEVRRALTGAVQVCSYDEVERSVDRLAVRLTAVLQDQDPVILTVMQGGLVFSGMLMRRIVFPCQLGYVRVARYGAGTQGGELRWGDRDCPELTGRTVVLIDDIHDRGRTLEALADWVRAEGAAQVLRAVLVERDGVARSQGDADFAALRLGDGFLIGCGMDFAGYGRNLPGIYMLAEAPP